MGRCGASIMPHNAPYCGPIMGRIMAHRARRICLRISAASLADTALQSPGQRVQRNQRAQRISQVTHLPVNGFAQNQHDIRSRRVFRPSPMGPKSGKSGQSGQIGTKSGQSGPFLIGDCWRRGPAPAESQQSGKSGQSGTKSGQIGTNRDKSGKIEALGPDFPDCCPKSGQIGTNRDKSGQILKKSAHSVPILPICPDLSRLSRLSRCVVPILPILSRQTRSCDTTSRPDCHIRCL